MQQEVVVVVVELVVVDVEAIIQCRNYSVETR